MATTSRYNLRKRPAPVATEPPPPKVTKVVSKTTKVAPQVTKAEPKVRKTEPKVTKAEPKVAKAEPKVKKAASKITKAEPEVSKVELEVSKVEPEVSKVEPVVSKVEPKVTKLEDQQVEKSSPKSSERQLVALFGSDTCGELGQGKTGFTKLNPSVLNLSVQQVACGAMHTLCLVDNQVYSFGCNDELALGRETNGEEDLESRPELIKSLESYSITKVTAGDSHSAALTDKHEVLVWGNFRDEHGSVGLNPEADGKPSLNPIKIMPDKKFKDIASGSNHMLLVDEEGEVYSFGVAEQGQLGHVSEEESKKKESRVKFLTPQKIDFTDVDSSRKFVCDAVFAGNYSSFAINTDKKKNRTAGWGLNNYSQLGFKGKNQNVQYSPKRSTFTCSTSLRSIACGQHHTLFLTKTGRVYAAGRHNYGMLGLGEVDAPVCPAKLIEELKSKTIVDISAGINTSFAVDSEGRLYSWGMAGPNLGHKDDGDILTPKQICTKNLEGKRVLTVSSGSTHTASIHND